MGCQLEFSLLHRISLSPKGTCPPRSTTLQHLSFSASLAQESLPYLSLSPPQLPYTTALRSNLVSQLLVRQQYRKQTISRWEETRLRPQSPCACATPCVTVRYAETIWRVKRSCWIRHNLAFLLLHSLSARPCSGRWLRLSILAFTVSREVMVCWIPFELFKKDSTSGWDLCPVLAERHAWRL